MRTRVCAVQLPFMFFGTPQEFADYVRVPVESAAQHGAQFILLPHLTSLMLFGMFDPGARADESLDDLAARQNMSASEWLGERAGYVFEFYVHLFQSFASRVEVWLAPGTVIEPDGEELYLSEFLFNPAGETVGRQRQIHPNAAELRWGARQGETLRVFETEIGDVGFLIGDDILHPGLVSGLIRNSANVLLHPAAKKVGSNTDEVSSTDLPNPLKSNPAFGVQSNLVGSGFRGGSAIYAPAEMTGDKSGILAHATNDAEGQLVLADLDFDALAQVRAKASLFR